MANAGISAPGRGTRSAPQDFNDVIDINVTGVRNTAMARAPHIVAGGNGGSIMLTSSEAGIKLQPFMIHYTASKHASPA